jgi:hypothetical protein
MGWAAMGKSQMAGYGLTSVVDDLCQVLLCAVDFEMETAFSDGYVMEKQPDCGMLMSRADDF